VNICVHHVDGIIFSPLLSFQQVSLLLQLADDQLGSDNPLHAGRITIPGKNKRNP
jgi:hypothetical protein